MDVFGSKMDLKITVAASKPKRHSNFFSGSNDSNAFAIILKSGHDF